MSMKKMLAVVAAAALVAIAAPAFAANPFSDVPLNHWAYDAVAQLTSRGVISGYPDGTFKGNKAMTRYEIASIIARALANAEYASKEDFERLKALVVEFQPELEALGVTVDGFDKRISALEKGVGGWKLSGEMRVDFNSADSTNDNISLSRTRLFMHKDLANGLAFDARFDNTNFDRWWLTANNFLGWDGFKLRAGLFQINWEGDDGLVTDDDGFMMDKNYQGYELKKTFGMGDFTVFAADGFEGDIDDAPAKAHKVKDRTYANVYGTKLKFNFNEKFWMSANAYIVNFDAEQKEKDKDLAGENVKTYWIAAGAKFMNGINLNGAYYWQKVDNRAANDDPKAWRIMALISQDVLKFTSLNLEYARLDKAFWKQQDTYTKVLTPMGSGLVPDDTKVFFVSATQKWTEKWSTQLRFAKLDVNDYGDVTDWSAQVSYQYTPALRFELCYEDIDYDEVKWSTKSDDKVVRFRTQFYF